MQSKIKITSTQLAIRYSEESDVPVRFRAESSGIAKSKSKASEAIEIRFAHQVESWASLIVSMLSGLDADQVWRFIATKPLVSVNISSITQCQDFLVFNAYFSRRRDDEACSNEETGQLAILLSELQREVERKLSV